jgi:hypothetical protein
LFSNGPSIVTTGLDLLVDAADQQSYPGSGTVWRDLRSGTTGSLTGSVSYTSEFYGGLTFSDSSSAVIFPGTTANYGTGSFTVEMAFKPTFINGRHYLMSKNSGSFPNWAIYLSGSSGQGKLWSEFRINASVSCSVSSSTTFVTGSVYQVDIRILTGASASGIYVNGQSEGGVFGNGGGSLTSTASLFVGNFSQNNTQNFSGSIYTVKSYTVQSLQQPPLNYNVTATRLGKAPAPYVAPVFELLVVAGGGGGAAGIGGGGGAGGLQYFSNFTPTSGTSQVIVGGGGAQGGPPQKGRNSSFESYVSFGGGGGAGGNNNAYPTIRDGGSGGGGGYGGVTPGTGIVGQGNDGGTAAGGFNSAGGGGAGSVGTSGAGGSGSFIPSFVDIGGSPTGWFAGGGGGGYLPSNTNNGGIGGGGGGGGNTLPGRTGSANTGGGGGGGSSGGAAGGAGGSGIVAIRYSGTPIALGGEITQSEGFTYHVFRTVGTSSFTIF